QLAVAAKQDDLPGGGVERHRRLDAWLWRGRRRQLRPRLAVPLPGVAEVRTGPTAEQDHAAAAAVERHRMFDPPWWSACGAFFPVVAVVLPQRVGHHHGRYADLFLAAEHQRASTDAVVGQHLVQPRWCRMRRRAGPPRSAVPLERLVARDDDKP